MLKIFINLCFLLLAAIAGAHLASHEERTLDYNLEDEELDLLKNLEGRLQGDERLVVAKVRAAAAAAKAEEQKAVGWVKRLLGKLKFWK